MTLRAWLFVAALLCAVYAYAMFREDNHWECDCGCDECDDWAECSTCHDCGKVRR